MHRGSTQELITCHFPRCVQPSALPAFSVNLNRYFLVLVCYKQHHILCMCALFTTYVPRLHLLPAVCMCMCVCVYIYIYIAELHAWICYLCVCRCTCVCVYMYQVQTCMHKRGLICLRGGSENMFRTLTHTVCIHAYMNLMHTQTCVPTLKTAYTCWFLENGRRKKRPISECKVIRSVAYMGHAVKRDSIDEL
jgi:hypothetical protein